MQLDFLITPETPSKGKGLLRALQDGAEKLGLDVRTIEGGDPREGAGLVLYGLGAPERIRFANRPNLVAWDAGYWERKLHPMQRKYRVSIGGFHCPQLIMRGERPSAERWNESHLHIAQGGDPNGPVMLIGNGPKSNAAGAGGWTAAMARKLRKYFHERKILYRPKPRRPHEYGIDYDMISTASIDSEVSKASLVVCRHSNVAVDACRAGVPVVCEDGAAASIYPRSLSDYQAQPDAATREEFLHRLAYWQWSPVECAEGKFWKWLEGINAIH